MNFRGSFSLIVLSLASGIVEGFQPIIQNQLTHSRPRNQAGFANQQPNHGVLSKSSITQLYMSDSTGETSPVKESEKAVGVDFKALGKYVLAIAVQMGLITSVFTGLEKLVAMSNKTVPFSLNVVFFYFMALKSRTFNPLSNRRPLPKTKEVEGAKKRKMPTWTPPGFVFPIVWLLLIGPLRAITSSMIYQTTGTYANKAILSLMLHLSIGDVWNTINNVESRYGTSVVFMSFVWSSAAFAAYQYSKVLPLAGKLLSLKLIWLTIAASLIVRTWQINPDLKTGKKYSLLPRRDDDAETKFMWFGKAGGSDK